MLVVDRTTTTEKGARTCELFIFVADGLVSFNEIHYGGSLHNNTLCIPATQH